MADIELVISIDDGIIEYIKNNDCLAACYNDEVAKAIKNGTPLPKGHGRLIDEDSILRIAKSTQTVVDINNAPTVVEAD